MFRFLILILGIMASLLSTATLAQGREAVLSGAWSFLVGGSTWDAVLKPEKLKNEQGQLQTAYCGIASRSDDSTKTDRLCVFQKMKENMLVLEFNKIAIACQAPFRPSEPMDGDCSIMGLQRIDFKATRVAVAKSK